MKNLMLFSIVTFLLFPGFVAAQDAKEILKKSQEATSLIKMGVYELHYTWKPMTEKDTLSSVLKSEFLRVGNDSIFPVKFKYEEGDFAKWYTGDELIWIDNKEKTATILARNEHNDFIYRIKHNYKLFNPVTHTNTFYSKILEDEKIIYTLEPENINNNKLKIILTTPDSQDSITGMSFLNPTKILWIDTKTYYAFRYDNLVDVVMDGDTMHQFISQSLNTFSFENLFEEDYFTLDKIPSFLNIKYYSKEKTIPLLPYGTVAPDWELNDLNGDAAILENYKDKLVLIDFFYKSCFPCLKAIPVLQSLHDKYNDKGLKVIGIDPFDKDVNDLKTFLAKRGVTYTILLSEKTVAQDYNVTGYPTLYLLDKKGKILYSHSGFSPELEEELEEIILENL